MAKMPAPTKGNLMAAKNTLKLSEQGYEMLDKKRNILIREMMSLIDEAKTIDDEIEIVVQINGKIKDKIMAARDESPEATQEKALANERVKELIEGKEIVKVICVPGKLVNIVVK